MPLSVDLLPFFTAFLVDPDFFTDDLFDLDAELFFDLLLDDLVGLGSSLRKVVVTLMKEDPSGKVGLALDIPAITFFLSTDKVFFVDIFGLDLLV